MGRPRTGPRPDSKSSPVLYAHLKVGTRWLKESLRTADKATALDRYPSAMRRLRDKANGIETVVQVVRPADPAVVFDQRDDGSFVERVTTAAEIFDPEVFEVTWQQALQLHSQRQAEKRGRTLAASTITSIRAAIAGMTATPSEITTNHIRDYVKGLKESGYSATTVSQRCGLLKALTETLVKQDLLASNPWKRVDTSAKGTNHIREATPAEIKQILESDDTALIALAFTGLRVGELCSREPRHLENGWLSIEGTDTWRPKTEDSVRRLPLPSWLQLELPTLRKTTMSRRLHLICPGLTCHGLRHSMKTAIREAGIAFDLGEYILGHAQPGGAISSIYGSFSDEAVVRGIEQVWKVLERWAKGS